MPLVCTWNWLIASWPGAFTVPKIPASELVPSTEVDIDAIWEPAMLLL